MTQTQVAAIVYDPPEDVDGPLLACVAALEAEGVQVGGLLQQFGAPIGACKREMMLTVLPGRATIRLNDPRGPGVLGCTLDVDALTHAAVVLQATVRTRPDLLAVARFGKEEAAGGGLREELAEALLEGIPLLIGVRRSLLPAWQDFLGWPSIVLPPRAPALLAWARSVVAGAAERWVAASVAP